MLLGLLGLRVFLGCFLGWDIVYISFRGMTGKPCGVVFEVLPGFAGPRGWFSEIIKVFLPSLEIKGSD